MNLKSYFDAELRTTLIHTAVAAVMGYVSLLINHTAFATLAAVAVLAVLTLALRAAWKIKEDKKWWLGNGVIVYIFVWLVVWTIFYNAYVLR